MYVGQELIMSYSENVKSTKSKHVVKTYIILVKHSHLNLKTLQVLLHNIILPLNNLIHIFFIGRTVGFDSYSAVVSGLPMYGTKTTMLFHI